MHLVRSVYGAIFIDEQDLVSRRLMHITTSQLMACTQSINNLCSAYSYCLSILDTVYVWHGKGSILEERSAAVAYAQSFSGADNVVTLTEGVDDDDEMFWMILGSDEYANADYWRWRSTGTNIEPKLWQYDSNRAPHSVSLCLITFSRF
jgi:hypothetical protein